MAKELLTDEEITQAYDLWCMGYSQEEIAEFYGVSTRTIMRCFARRKMKKRKPPIEPPKMCH